MAIRRWAPVVMTIGVGRKSTKTEQARSSGSTHPAQCGSGAVSSGCAFTITHRYLQDEVLDGGRAAVNAADRHLVRPSSALHRSRC